MPNLSFFGAAGTVTGSCSLVETDHARFLVDCGMFQGNKTIRALNAEAFPFEPETIDFVILTHAHIDHSGLLPKLTKAGFTGRIYCTAPTADLLEFMLRDSAKIQEATNERHNRRRERKGEEPVAPIYVDEDALKTLSLLQPVHYDHWFDPKSGVRIRYRNAGHMLGSASAEIMFQEDAGGNTLRLLFSGDLGPEYKVFHPEPTAEAGFDYIVCESTYGDRDRDDYTLEARREMLRNELVRGLSAGGNVVIPAFAVERSQELLHDIGVLLATGQLPETMVFLDSPLASAVTEVFVKYGHLLDDIELPESALFRDPHFRIVQDVSESKAINRITSGAIIISASGMADAGRVQHHIKNNIWRRNATILFVGYQAPGTLGHYITSGEPVVRIHGKEFAVRAEIRSLGNYSAHADQAELIDWIMDRAPVSGKLFLNHGEDDAREEMTRLLAKRGFDADKIILPQMDEMFELVAGDARSKGRLPERIPQSELVSDWNNDYAAFIVALTERLNSAANDHERRAVISELRRTL